MSTFASLHYHIVFSTKYRQPTIKDTWLSRLHDYLGGTVKSLDGFPQGIGGIEDHVHLLVGLRPNHCISDFMRELKKSSRFGFMKRSVVRNFNGKKATAFFP
jgi:REP element-mobilizing transposase RayT